VERTATRVTKILTQENRAVWSRRIVVVELDCTRMVRTDLT
jgi:hypothetical protein